ncbi:AMMECR1-like protein [Grifola frondosa]|uniref:AMMECR1-like protein n=1 Tax=Grifola frondosa TaxID=5627 RepID=A0A1C7MNZ9_GRIFR|nr:AMMECR1-like protein [Grifola frondosa]
MALVSPTSSVNVGEDEGGNVCTPEHCFHSFDALFCTLTSSKPIPPKFSDDKYPLFVTWNTKPSRPGRSPRLRGCIGTFEPLPLRDGLAEYALISAFRDSRFRKIEERELENLECCISLLTDFEDALSYVDWTVGVHGIYITFPHPSLITSSSPSSSSAPSPLSSSASLLTHNSLKHTFSATYLPHVAEEQGWDKIETVDSAIRKAGWSGRITEDLRRNVKLRRNMLCLVEERLVAGRCAAGVGRSKWWSPAGNGGLA